MLNFGPGLVSVQMMADKNAESVTVPQPFPIHGANNFSLDIQDSMKGFQAGMGAIEIHKALESRKISGSIEGPIPADLLAQIITGVQEQTRGTICLKSPSTAIVAVTGASVTKVAYTIPDAGTFVEDFGLSLLGDDGSVTPMLRNDDDTPTGFGYKLTVSDQTVTYTVDNAHAGKKFIADVVYSKSGFGISFDIANPLPGESPVFKIMHSGEFRNMRQMTRMYWCVFTKYPVMAGKLGDFSMGKLEFECFAPLGQKAGDVVRTRREI